MRTKGELRNFARTLVPLTLYKQLVPHPSQKLVLREALPSRRAHLTSIVKAVCTTRRDHPLPDPLPPPLGASPFFVSQKPDNVRELRGFLGLANYYSGYVGNYASIATPLIEMLKNLPKHKNGEKIGLTWNASANEAFLKLKRAITDIVPLQLADWDKDFVLTPDASNWAVGWPYNRRVPMMLYAPLPFSPVNCQAAY